MNSKIRVNSILEFSKICAKTNVEPCFSRQQRREMQSFQKSSYASAAYNVPIESDPFGESDLIFCSRPENASSTLSLRIVFDSNEKLPADAVCADELLAVRQSGKAIAELGRFCGSENSRLTLLRMYRACYELGQLLMLDSYVAILMSKNRGMYENLLGINTLVERVPHDYGTGKQYSLIEWPLEKTTQRFLAMTE